MNSILWVWESTAKPTNGRVDSRVWSMRLYGKPDELSRLQVAQLARARDALVRLVHAFYSILEFTVALGKFLCDFVRAARDITAGVSCTI
jgi:hypothetical protein